MSRSGVCLAQPFWDFLQFDLDGRSRAMIMMQGRVAWCMLLIVLLLGTVTGAALACCNVTPHTGHLFTSTLGSTSRPYAAPGELVEFRLRACDDSPGFSGTDAD